MDYSQIESMEQARALYEKGELAKLYLLPIEFGGQDSENNVVYVPDTIVEEKARIDFSIVLPLIQNGSVSEYEAMPEYNGASFIPTKIIITAQEPKSFMATIAIWGTALQKEE